MEELNKKYPIEIEIVTPVSIGGGAEKDWVNGLDFVESENKIYKLNLRRLFQPDSGVDVERLLPLFEKRDKQGVLRLLRNKLDRVSDAVFDMTFYSANDIKAFIKNELSGKPVIPGSSLKGAIRSVLFKELKDPTEKKEKIVFGESDKGDEFMRFLKFSDVEFEKTGLVNTKIFNLRSGEKPGSFEGGWKHSWAETTSAYKPSGFNTIYEALMPGQRADGVMLLSDKLFDLFYRSDLEDVSYFKVDDKRRLLDVSNLFQCINVHTRAYLDKEIEFFNTYRTDRVDSILDSLNEIRSGSDFRSSSSCILKMAAGSGFHSITGDWQFGDFSIDEIRSQGRNRGYFNDRPSAKSRKIAITKDAFYLMGFVRLRLLSEEEIQEKGQRQKARFEAIEHLRKQEVERKREELERQENRKRYDTLIQEARACDQRGDRKAALAKYNAAAAICPDGSLHEVPIQEIELFLQRQLEKEELEKQNAEAERERLRKQQVFVEGGLAFLTEERNGRFVVKDLKMAVNRVESWLKKSGNQYVPIDQEEILIQALIRLYKAEKKRELKRWEKQSEGHWKSISKIVSADRIEIVFKKVIG
ncbi:type III-A CRISPR-associated RAMP protein Csm5 [Parabacteroides sp. ZJ-118]|uniref:type III-A CRISPR-associated RAMP protein Csm5 n=1 Tax=Parabacteroides sp. ZJ-118 TaxID=2709398 RepID=UPI0013ED144A|nr:type III-A CRISPR-associated RAMP protein Csm5 [Parabacteroides sp. ZJ-118]